MASLDSLNIEIKANASEATSAINTLTASLQNLNKQLGLKDGTKFTKILEQISGAANAMSEKINNISGQGFEKAAQGAQEASKAVETLQEQADAVSKTLNGLGNTKFGIPKELTSGTNSSLKGIQNLGFTSDIQGMKNVAMLYSDLKESLEGIHTPDLDAYFGNIEKQLPAIVNSAKMLPAVIDTQKFQKLSQYASEAAQKTEALKKAAQGGDNDPFGETSESAKKVTSAIEQALNDVKEFKKIISDMEGQKTPFDEGKYANAVKGLRDATKAVDNYKKALIGGEKKESPGNDVLTNIVELGEALEKVGEKFNMVAEKGISMFKVLTTPLKKASEEYVEKFHHMTENVANFQKNFKVHMKKVSDFWKRTMRTFTFMIVRKVFTAIIKEVANAIQSMAKFSDQMGTEFNKSMSLLVADFQYLGRSIVSVFAPLINIIAPIIDAIVSKIATLLSYIGMLFSFLGGKSTFTKAKKDVNNYAAGLDKASKSAKNLTMGIDELNILADNKSGGGNSGNPLAEWEDVEIPQWIKDLGKWLKDLWDKFWSPFKEAWDRAKQYVIDGFKTMLNSLSRLLSDMGRDFLEVWNQEKTIHMLEQVFRIIGDIFRVVRNLANAFDEAWNYNRTGFKILQNIRDILAILVEHARNISYYMIEWSKEIDFKPMLTSFEQLTSSAKRFADFIGGVVEDIFIYGILKYIDFLIVDAIPHLQLTIASILDAFNFVELREKLRPLIESIEEMLQNLHTGVTNAIGNLGRELAQFVNSGEFYQFLESITNISKEITAARVEKVLTGLGEGILDIGKAVVKFVNSQTFQKFIKAIGAWIDKSSTKDIAKVLTRIANAILLFKFGSFAAEKLSGFFKFVTVLTALKNLRTIASEMTGTATAMTALGSSAPAVGALYNPLARFSGILPTLSSNIGTTVGAFKNMFSVMGVGGGIKGIFEAGTTAINGFAASLSPLTVLIGSVTTAFLEWKGVEKSASDLAHALNGDDDYSVGGSILGIVGKIGIASAAFTAFLGFPTGLVAGLVVGAISAIKGIQETVEQINFERIGDAITTQGEMTISQVKSWYTQATDIVNENISKWKDAERNLTQDRGDIAEYAKEVQNFSSVFENASGVTAGVADKLVGKYEDLKSSIENYIDQSTDALVSNLLAQKAFLEAQGIDVDQMIVDIYKRADEQKKAVDDVVNNVKEAVKGLDGLAEGTKAYDDQMQKVIQSTKDASSVLSDYYDSFSSIDTSAAVQEIESLGKSLDLSQYVDNPDEALTAIAQGIDDVKSTYTSKMEELKSEADRLKEEAKLMPDITDAELNAFNLSVDYAYSQAQNQLTAASNQVLGVYSQELATQMSDVANNAAADWEKGIVTTFLQPYSTKEEYILYELYQHNNRIVEDGVQKSLQDAYSVIPSNIETDVVTAMNSIVENEEGAYRSALMDGTFYDDNYNMLNNVLGAVDSLDYTTPANTFSTQHYNAMYQAMQGYDYQSLGHLWNTEAGGAVLSNSQIFADQNRLTANEGAAAFSQEYRDFLTENTDTISALQETGASYGGSIIEGLNQKIETDMATTTPFINDWFKLIDTNIHDNPFMPFGSPNKKTREYGKDTIDGFNLGITTNAQTSKQAIAAWFTVINLEIQSRLTFVKAQFNRMLSGIFSGQDFDALTPIATLFSNITLVLTTKMTELGDYMVSGLIPNFIATYLTPAFDQIKTWFNEIAMVGFWDENLLPWFSADKWDEGIFTPLMENILLHYESFIEWWDEKIADWWETHLLDPWFTKDKWDEDAFIPLKNNIHEHWKSFITWWDKSMTDWWDNHVMPWIEKWNKMLETISKTTEDTTYTTFYNVRKTIKYYIEKAQEAVAEACEQMIKDIQSVIDKIDDLLDKVKTAEGMGINIKSLFMADGGFVNKGDLFFANEAGPELIGTIGGRTAVASNSEITGIADAVYATGSQESALLGQLISLTKAIVDKDPVVIGDKDIARMANNGQSQLGMTIIS